MNEYELDSYERSIVQAGRDVPGPSEVQRTRVRRAIGARLAAGAVLAFSVGTPALATAFKIGAVAIVGGGLAVGTYFVATPSRLRQPQHERVRPAVTMPRMETAPATPTVVDPAEVPEVVPAPVQTSPRREVRRSPTRVSLASVPRSQPRDLSAELSLLGEAKAAIERGNPQRALELLRTYDKSFHHGMLAEERMATGVLYLCAVGRIDDAKTKARQFVDRYPRSPLLVRIEGSCAGKVNALK